MPNPETRGSKELKNKIKTAVRNIRLFRFFVSLFVMLLCEKMAARAMHM